MRVSRREWVKAGVAFGASALLPGSIEAALTRPRSGGDAPGALFTRRGFESQRNRLFRVQGEAAGAVLRLVDVRDPLTARAAGTAGSQTCFSLILRGPRSHRLLQGTYTVNNTRFGTFDLFLVPVGRPVGRLGAWVTYEAAYNLI